MSRYPKQVQNELTGGRELKCIACRKLIQTKRLNVLDIHIPVKPYWFRYYAHRDPACTDTMLLQGTRMALKS